MPVTVRCFDLLPNLPSNAPDLKSGLDFPIRNLYRLSFTMMLHEVSSQGNLSSRLRSLIREKLSQTPPKFNICFEAARLDRL